MWFCNNMTSTFFSEGAILTVVPPANAAPNNSSDVAITKTYVGNSKELKISTKNKGD